MEASLFDRLTERQRSCLRLVGALANSKEIARELGISRHTVDEHIRVAMATLGLSSRYEAARALAAHEAGAPPQRLSSQPVGIEPEVPAGPLPSSFGKQGDERQGTAIEAPADEAVPPPLSLWPAPPFPTRRAAE